MPKGHGGGAHSDEHNHGKPDRDLRDVISTLTHHLTGLGKDGSGGSGTNDHGVGIVTLAGSNKGAVMKADRLDEAMDPDVVGGGETMLSAYTNSNYQAVNNSIMIDGRCEAEDPGVHIEIVDCLEEEEDDDDGSDDEREKKKKKKMKEKKEKKEMKEKKEKKEMKEKKEKKEGNGSGSE